MKPERKLEHHIPIEHKIIHLMLTNRETVRELMDEGYTPSLFDPGHHRIVQAIYDAFNDHEKLLTRNGYLEYVKADGVRGDLPQYMTVYDKCRMQSDPLTMDDLGYLKANFKEAIMSRHAESCIRAFVEQTKTEPYTTAVDTLVSRLGEKLAEIETKKTNNIKPAKEEMTQYITLATEHDHYYNSGIIDIDNSIDGLASGETGVIVARPGTGKSALVLQWSDASALIAPVLVISLEMPKKDIYRRMFLRNSSYGINNNGVVEQEMKDFFSERKDIYVIDNLHTLEEITRTIIQYKKKHGIGFVVIDYLQLITAAKRNARHEEIADISRKLKQCALEHDVAILCVAQSNREENRKIQTGEISPDLINIAGSDGIGRDCDLCLYITCSPEEKDLYEQPISVFCLKRRNGPIKSFKMDLIFNKPRQLIQPVEVAEHIAPVTSPKPMLSFDHI